jgi:hypothetical protein
LVTVTAICSPLFNPPRVMVEPTFAGVAVLEAFAEDDGAADDPPVVTAWSPFPAVSAMAMAMMATTAVPMPARIFRPVRRLRLRRGGGPCDGGP